MGQRTDQMNAQDPDATVIMGREDAGGSGGTTSDVSPADIEQTRSEMSGTLAALGDKLNPHALAQEAKDVAADATQHVMDAVPEITDHAKQLASDVTDHAKEAITEAAAAAAQHLRDAATDVVQHIKETLPEVAANAGHHAVSGAVNEAKHAIGGAVSTAKGASMTLLDRIKQNPVPAAIAGLGLYWLLRGGEGQQSSGALGTGTRYPGSQGYSEQYGTGYGRPQSSGIGQSIGQAVGAAGSKVGSVAGQVQDKAGDLVDGLQDKASGVVESVQHAAGGVVGSVQHAAGGVVDSVQHAAGSASDTIQYKAMESSDWFQRTLQQNPLAVVASAIALGTVLGLAIPETDKENEMMGETRDNLMQKAQDATQGIGDKVQSVAHEALGKVKEEAQNQGLTAKS